MCKNTETCFSPIVSSKAAIIIDGWQNCFYVKLIFNFFFGFHRLLRKYFRFNFVAWQSILVMWEKTMFKKITTVDICEEDLFLCFKHL